MFVAAKNYVANLFSREDGQAAPEYVMIIGFISLLVVLAFLTTGVVDAIGDMVTKVISVIGGDAPT